MRKKLLLCGCFLLSGLAPNLLSAQSEEAQQLILNVEKLTQLKAILKNLYHGYEIVSKGYNTIRELTRGNFDLHRSFLDGLLEISPEVRKYKRVGDIISCQTLIVREQKRAYSHFKAEANLTISEIGYVRKVSQDLLARSLKDTEDLLVIVTAGKLRMSDDERLAAIDKIYQSISQKLSFLKAFNNRAAVLALQRAKESNDVRTTKEVLGIK
ncbi:TerB family tellurite resistance protein [Segetibacter sp. 3557_3]|uniref:TerB family tellurite resistance protein n=1 Tax=Segetibacter sp. 3557_3 TaxID=2547429 RepID=UPI001058E058|nr:TerB family tellurite resistance protein [Segetibacter sp. 3557_3]TDH18041.1 TerB family tellurite resistance protein [Segetibacter sp. 3557_3]